MPSKQRAWVHLHGGRYANNKASKAQNAASVQGVQSVQPRPQRLRPVSPPPLTAKKSSVFIFLAAAKWPLRARYSMNYGLLGLSRVRPCQRCVSQGKADKCVDVSTGRRRGACPHISRPRTLPPLLVG